MKAINLKVEYLNNPMGIDVINPRFCWNVDDCKKQTAYQIRCTRDDAIIFDSGRVESDQTSLIDYNGEPLHSRDVVNWQLKVWDENNAEAENSSSFEIGLLNKDDFVGKWISGNYEAEKNVRYPVDHFKREFRISKNITKARLYMSACGIYYAYLNNKPVSENVLAPWASDYRKRIQYQTYDVTALLGKENTWEIELGDGYYKGSLGAFGIENVYGNKTAVYGQLEITYDDGSTEKIVTSRDFAWSNDGMIRFNDLQDGETVDFNLRHSYCSCALEVDKQVCLTVSNNASLSRHEVFDGKCIVREKDYRIYEFSQNLSGVISLKIKGHKNRKVTIRLGETLKDNHVFLKQIQEKRPVNEFSKIETITVPTYMWKPKNDVYRLTPLQEVTLYLSGNWDEYEMKFAIAGFRYAEVLCDQNVEIQDFKSIAVYSNLEELSRFECSNEAVNRLYQNTLWSMKSNYLDVPTDCPTRERMGWTGDAQVFFDTAAF